MNRLPLKRPLVIFDLETTGTHVVADRIVEIAALKVNPDGGRQEWVYVVNPGVPIPAEATAVHGIGDEDVRDAPRFADIAEELGSFLEGCDLGGFNILRFDLPFLAEEFKRAGVPFSEEGRALVDAQVIFHKKEPRTLEAALRYYCGEEHSDAHSARGDVEATFRVLDAQIERYADLPATMEELHDFCDQRDPRFLDRRGKLFWKDSEVCVDIKPHKGRTLRDLVENEPKFLQWILRKDFSADVKDIVSKALEGVFPERPQAPERKERRNDVETPVPLGSGLDRANEAAADSTLGGRDEKGDSQGRLW